MFSPRQRFYFIAGLVSGTFFFTVCVGPVFTLFLLKLGVREKIIGMLSVLPSIIGITTFWMAKSVGANPSKHFIQSSWNIVLIEFCFLPLFLASEFLPATTILALFSFLLCLFYFFMQQYVYSWFPVISSVIPDHERGHFLGVLRISLTFAGYALLQISSRILGSEPEYMRFFVVTGMIGSVSLLFPVFLSKAQIPQITMEPPDQTALTEEFIAIFRDANRSAYFRYLFMWTFISGIIGPFLIPFYRTELNLSASLCVGLVSANTLGYGLSVFGWGKLVDRYGSRYVLFVSCLMAILHLSILAHIHLFPVELIKIYAMACSFLGGVVFAGQLMGDTTRRMALAPQEKRSSYFACMLVLGAQAPLLVASPVSGFLIQRYRNFTIGCYGIYQVAILATMFFHLVLLWQIQKMHPIKEKPVMELLRNSLTEFLMKVRDAIASPP